MLINTQGFLFSVQKGASFPKGAVSCFGAVCFKKPHLLSRYGKYFNWFGVREVCCWAGTGPGEAGSYMLLCVGKEPHYALFDVQLLSCSQYQGLRC